MLDESDFEWPRFGLVDDVRPALRRARDLKLPCVLATLVGLPGGGPRPIGSQMVFASGMIAGYFSGGCLEADVARHAESCMADGRPRHLLYGQGSPWPDVRLLCGVRVEIFLERICPDDAALDQLLCAEQQRRPVVWSSDGLVRSCMPENPPPAPVAKLYTPPLRLLVVGGDPTAMAIAELGARTGLLTTIVRPLGPARPPPIENVAYVRGALPQALLDSKIDAWTALAIATHDEALDQLALEVGLNSAAGYVGLLGAHTRLEGRLSRLRQTGIAEDAIQRLHAPIGLPIGGKAPWEVAVSVIAEIIASQKRGQAGFDGSVEAPSGQPAVCRAEAERLGP